MAVVWKLDLPPNKKLVLLAYADHADDEGNNVFPSLPRVAHKTGYSKDQVRRISRDLRTDGLMELVQQAHGRGHPARYRLTLEKGIKLQPFNKAPEPPERVASDDIKGGTDATLTINRETPDATLSAAAAPDAPAKDDNRTGNQHLTDDLYRRMQDAHKVRLTKEQYAFHLGRFKEMLDKDEPSDEELDLVIAHMVNKLPANPKLDGVKALQDVRMGRHDGSAWDGPAPWAGQSNLPEHEQWKESYYKNWDNYTPDNTSRELTEEEQAQVAARRKALLERIGNDA